MKSLNMNPLIFCALALTLSAPLAYAQPNSFFTPGDLVLFFQKEGGADTVYARLGDSATTFRGTVAGPGGASNSVNFLDVSAELAAAFGAGWASDPEVYAGLCAVWGTSNTQNNLQNGDPQRTLYVSKPRFDVGTVGLASSPAWNFTTAGDGAMTSGSTGIFTNNNPFETTYDVVKTVSPTSISRIDEGNPFLGAGVQGTAFQGSFPGGVQQVGTAGSFGTFGAAGSVEFALDLYRIQARNNIAGQVTGTNRVGSYEGTVTVNGSGQVSFISQGSAPASPFSAWVDGFNPPLTNVSDRLPQADFDNDGFVNLEEFVLNGNPGVSSQAIAPLLAVDETNFVFSFNRRDDSESEAPVVFQYGSDLSSWADVPVGAASGPVGIASINVDDVNTTIDAITVTIPKTVAAGGKLFGRIKIVK